MEKEWYCIASQSNLDSPSLVIYPDRVKKNIVVLLSMVKDPTYLRPHVKTHKCKEIVQFCIEAGIHKFKCATIAEAELLAMVGAKDVLLAYQPQGPKQERFLKLIHRYPQTRFSCLIDNIKTGWELSGKAVNSSLEIHWFLDLNVGMNRTGILPNSVAADIYIEIAQLPGMVARGLHVYDGHIQDSPLEVRKKNCNKAFLEVENLIEKLKIQNLTTSVIAGGSSTFPIHAERRNVECSPGTFIYWDYGYQLLFPEQRFLNAAVLVTRVISQLDEFTYCLDLGHKSVASEKPLDQRIHFLNLPDVKFISQSEEHLVIKTDTSNFLHIGQVIYGLPYHICPTVALYEEVQVIENQNWVGTWKNIARNRRITI